jgi:hypothetical protein
MTELKDRHYRAIEMMVAGKSNVYIAQNLGVTSGTISVWRKDSRFLKEYIEYRASYEERVEDSWARMFPLVFRTLEDLLGSDNEYIQLSACNLWLRSVGRIIERVAIKHESPSHMSDEELKEKIKESTVALEEKLNKIDRFIERKLNQNNSD